MLGNTSNKEDKGQNVQTFETLQLIVFKLGEEEYGINIDQIKEVVITPNITQMPQTPNFVKGVANIRGNIIGIVDLEEKFGIAKGISTDDVNRVSNYTLVVESEQIKVGILVKEVPNTLTVKSSNIEQNVSIIHDKNVDSDFIDGLVKLENRLIILINILKVLTEDILEKIDTPQENAS